MKYIDSHTHIHMTAADGRAFMDRIGFKDSWQGSVDEYLPIMDKVGIAKAMIVPLVHAAWILDQQMGNAEPKGRADRERFLNKLKSYWSAYNRWAAEQTRGGRFAALIGVDPVLMGSNWVRSEIRSNLPLGAVGLKIIPSYIEAYPRDPRMSVVWEEADRLRLPVLTLASHDCLGLVMFKMTPPETYRDINHPKHLAGILRDYPNVKIVTAHMCMGAEDEFVKMARTYDNLFTDLSMRLTGFANVPNPRPEETVKLIRRFGVERVMFGTNYPLNGGEEYVKAMERLALADHDAREIWWRNFERIYGTATA